MRTRTRTEPVILGGDEASGTDRIDSFDGRGTGNGSFSETPVFSLGTGGAGRGREDVVSQTTWFDPVEEISDCPGGVCPVPWTTKTETNSIFTIEDGPVLLGGDEVNHPDHYTDGAIECIEAIEAQLTADEYRGYLKGNIAKYIWRERMKGGVQSLKKAQWYLDRLIQFDEAQNG